MPGHGEHGRLVAGPAGTAAGWLAGMVAAVLGLWLVPLSPGHAARQQQPPTAAAKAKEAELKRMRGKIETIRKSIQAEAQRRDSLTEALRESELEVQSARERLEDVRAQRLAAQAKLQDLQAERSETQRKIDTERDALAGEVRAAYMNGHQEQLKLLLSQGDPARLGRLMTYYGYFGRARAERITAITEHLAHLELVSENIAAEADKLAALEADNARQVKSLAGARDRRKQTLAKVQSTLKTRNDELAKAQREAQALEKLVEQLRRAIEEFSDKQDSAFAKLKGKLPWPVRGSLLARFGSLRAGGPLRWQGMVIGAERGTQVRAPLAGRVIYADWLPGLGLLLVLDHGGGYMSLYGHNEQLYRKVGDRVAAGDPLSAVGEVTGMGKTGLYWEVRRGRQPVDPAAWLAKTGQ